MYLKYQKDKKEDIIMATLCIDLLNGEWTQWEGNQEDLLKMDIYFQSLTKKELMQGLKMIYMKKVYTEERKRKKEQLS